MARVVKDDVQWRSRGSARKYPWADWTDGRVWRVVRGEDFTCEVLVFARGVYQRASRDGMRVRARVDGDTVTFQFLPPEGDE